MDVKDLKLFLENVDENNLVVFEDCTKPKIKGFTIDMVEDRHGFFVLISKD